MDKKTKASLLSKLIFKRIAVKQSPSFTGSTVYRTKDESGRKPAEPTHHLIAACIQSISFSTIMALRAFHANPCIGGFGGESSGDILLLDTNDNARGNIGGGGNISQSGDALCQIVKELVDNAIDACGAVVAPSDDDKEDETTKSEKLHKVKVEIQPYNEDILQVYISDTGCGMGDIQSCVNAFASSKHDGDSETAGRYGIGLTLCLLHAQRLIPHKTCITSATKNAKYLTRAFYIVDTDGDSIVCDKTEKISKTTEDESGTCVSLLIPVRYN